MNGQPSHFGHAFTSIAPFGATSAPHWRACGLTILSLCCLTWAGCATTEFTPYTGQQQWRTSTGCLVNSNYAVPIFYGAPLQAYVVLGTITTDGSEREAAWAAKTHQADALVLLKSQTSSAGSYTLPTTSTYLGTDHNLVTGIHSGGATLPITTTIVGYAAIRFTTNLEARAP